MLASGIRLFDMQVEEIVVVPVLFQGRKFIRNGSSLHGQYLHPSHSGHPAVHAIDRNGSCPQAI